MVGCACKASPNDSQAPRKSQQVDRALYSGLLHQALAVGTHGIVTDEQLLADFLTVSALGDQFKNLQLPLGKIDPLGAGKDARPQRLGLTVTDL